MKIITDILKERGKWSIKRIVIFTAYLFALCYELIALFYSLNSKEYVFNGLLLLVATGLGLTVYAKQKKFSDEDN